MVAVLALLRADVRRTRRTLIVLTLLLGVFFGVVLGVAAGARRTATAFDRFRSEGRSEDLLISPSHTGFGNGFYDAVRALPAVADAGAVAGQIITPSVEALMSFQAAPTVVAGDRRTFRSVARPNVLRGRLAETAGEATVNKAYADAFDVDIGDRLELLVLSEQDVEQLEAMDAGGSPPDPRRVQFRITGVTVAAREVIPITPLDAAPTVSLPFAWFEANDDVANAFDGMAIRLRPGADPVRFRQDVEALAAERGDEVGEVFFDDTSEQAAKIRRAIRPQAIALALFALFAGLAGIAVLGQLVARQASVDGADHPVLRALGMGIGRLMAAVAIRIGAMAVVAAAVGVGVAVAMSPRFPIGPARLAEPSPGAAFDAPVLLGGAALLVVALVAFALHGTWRARAAVEHELRRAPSAVAGAAAGAGMPPAVITGLRLAFEPGRGRAAVPARSTLVSVALALAAVVGAATFGASLDRLVTRPANYGWSWDVSLDVDFGPIPIQEGDAALAEDASVAGFARGNFGEVLIDDRPVPAVGIDTVRGDVYPTILEGRPAAGDDEIVLGGRTMESFGVSIGDRLPVDVAGETRNLEVVGQAVFPAFGRGSFSATGLGIGAAMPTSVLPHGDTAGAVNFYLVTFRDDAGARDRQAVMDRFQEAACPDGFCTAAFDRKPADISNYERVRSTPAVLAALLAALGLATLAHALAVTILRRRRELSVLRAVGFTRRQVRLAVAAQATAVAVTGVAVGIPLGVALGRVGWSVFAREIGVGPVGTTPLLVVVALTAGAIVAANLLASFPGRRAARLVPAAGLRAE